MNTRFLIPLAGLSLLMAACSYSSGASGADNGATCSSDGECASGNCSESMGGDFYCYGNASSSDPCAVTQDCAAGLCQGGKCTTLGACSTDSECAVNAVCDSGRCMQVCGANAFASAATTCQCLPGFEWASRDPSDTNCVEMAVLPGCHLVAQDTAQTYLGQFGACYGMSSVCNEYGRYGSPYGTDSIFNKYGSYGSPYGAFSAFNDYSSSPPQVVCDGEVIGCVTTNQFVSCEGDRIAPSSLCSCP